MNIETEMSDKEMREVYELLTKEQLIVALINKQHEIRQVKTCNKPAVSSLLLIEECGFDDMVRRFNLPKDHDDYLCNDDTQIGWEECFKYIKAQLSNNC